MPNAMPAKDVLNREFLEIRAKILEIAASLDRLDRGSDGTFHSTDPRCGLIQQGIEILSNGERGDKAERVQLLFSQAFDESWRKQMGI